MSQYGDYSQKIFNESQKNSLRVSSEFGSEYIDFNPSYGFNQSRISNPDFQIHFSNEKNQLKDTTDAHVQKENQPEEKNLERKVRIIETSQSTKNLYLKCKRGSAYETMELNINFKTIFCKLIRQMSELKMLTKDEKQLFLRYKNESPSFKSLVKFLNSDQNRETKQKLRQLMESALVVRNINQSQLRIQNKVTMIKFLQVMRTTIRRGNPSLKWKTTFYK